VTSDGITSTPHFAKTGQLIQKSKWGQIGDAYLVLILIAFLVLHWFQAVLRSTETKWDKKYITEQ
jgi:hypothetical protein